MRISKETETFVVVISCNPVGRGYYDVSLADAEGEIYNIKAHEETVLDYRLVVNKELDYETFSALQNSMGYQKAYSYALNILSKRMYTKVEIKRKLTERDVTDDDIRRVVDKLIEIKLLDDYRYTSSYIEGQLRLAKKGKMRIISDLRQKGISKEMIMEFEDLFDEDAEKALIIKEIKQVYRRYLRKDLDEYEIKTKVLTYMGRKGYDFYATKREYEFFIEDYEAGLVEI